MFFHSSTTPLAGRSWGPEGWSERWGTYLVVRAESGGSARMTFFAPTAAGVTRDLAKNAPEFEWEVNFHEVGLYFECVGKPIRGVATPVSSDQGRITAGLNAEHLASRHKYYGFKVWLFTDEGLLVGMQVKQGPRGRSLKPEKLDYW
jgi:hypothetical protein